MRELARIRTRLLGRIHPVRTALTQLRPLLGRNPLKSVRFHSLAFLLGDYEGAMRAARRHLDSGDEQALFVYLASRWQAGEMEAALASAGEAARKGRDVERRATIRFFEFVEEPGHAQWVLESMRSPDPGLVLDIAHLWRRHGHPDRALPLINQVLARKPRHGRARDQRERAESDLALLRWAGAVNGSGRQASGAERVLHMVERSLPHHQAGSTFRTHYTLRAQRRAGLDSQAVTQAGFPGGIVSSVCEVHQDVPYHRIPDSGAETVRIDERLRRGVEALDPLVRRLRPAVLHPASDYRNALVALEVRERYGIPVVYEVRGFPEEYRRRRPGSRILYDEFGTRRRIEADCWRRADRIVTLADVMKRHIVSKGVEPERVAVIPNAVDAEVFSPVPRDPTLAARLGIENCDTVLGYVSTFASYEGIEFLVEAVARLTFAGHRVRGLLVGDGVERSYLEQLARRLKVADRVIFTGRVSHTDVPSYYGLIDVFVVPRTAETTSQLVTPLKPYEAMAMEKAVVVSRTEALGEMVIEGETGLTFNPESAEDLAATVELLIEDPDERRRLGASAREWVRANRSWNRNAQRYRELYAELGVGS